MKCELCKINEAAPTACNADGRRHYHGQIHVHPSWPTANGSTNHLAPVCLACGKLDADKFEQLSRAESELAAVRK